MDPIWICFYFLYKQYIRNSNYFHNIIWVIVFWYQVFIMSEMIHDVVKDAHVTIKIKKNFFFLQAKLVLFWYMKKKAAGRPNVSALANIQLSYSGRLHTIYRPLELLLCNSLGWLILVHASVCEKYCRGRMIPIESGKISIQSMDNIAGGLYNIHVVPLRFVLVQLHYQFIVDFGDFLTYHSGLFHQYWKNRAIGHCTTRVTSTDLKQNRIITWWRHQMETFSALLALCAGNSSVTDEFPSQRPVTRSFDVFFDLRLNKRLSKQSWGWWLETPKRSLWQWKMTMKKYLLPSKTHGFST